MEMKSLSQYGKKAEIPIFFACDEGFVKYMMGFHEVHHGKCRPQPEISYLHFTYGNYGSNPGKSACHGR